MEEQVEPINDPPAPQRRIPYRLPLAITDFFFSESRGEGDACSCILSLITLCFFVSLILVLGFFGPFDLVLGPNSSRLLRSNSFLVQDVQVRAVSGPKHELMLYGFLDTPSLDVNVAWLDSHNSSFPPNAQKAWVYYLNQGSHINISYSITPQGPYPLILVISQGRESLSRWIEDPLDPNITLFWKLIDGTGIIYQDIGGPSDYYIALANLNQIKMEVQLCFGIEALLYNTSGAYFKCSLHHRQCDWKLFFLQENSAVLTTSQDDTDNEWYVRLSYGPRWITYFICSGVVTLSLFMVYKIITTLKSNATGEGTPQVTEGVTERTSLLAGEDVDDQSLGSSYDSVSNDEEETDQLTALYLAIDGESDKHQCLCMICGNAQKDCFFLPCGHCATCFICGNRLLNNGDTCPVCQRNTKKLRKIFSA